MTRNWIILFLCFIGIIPQVGTCIYAKQNYSLKSPDGKLEILISVNNGVTYSLCREGKLLVNKSAIGMILKDGNHLGGNNAKVTKASRSSQTEAISTPLYRTASFTTHYNELNLRMKGAYGIHFRAYNEGVAYRFSTSFNDSIEIKEEIAEFNFDKDYQSWRAYSTGGVKDRFTTAFQNIYTSSKLSEAPTNNIAFLPVTVDLEKGVKLTVLESDLEAYPGMSIEANQTTSFRGAFARYPQKTKIHPTRCQLFIEERGNIIAKTKGSRNFPWRILAVTEKDTDMPINNLVYALATSNRIGDYSWVKGGLAAWEWWNDWGISDVNFKAGINMDTYKYYIDFASKYKLPFVVVDEGWYNPKSGDMLTVIPELDMPELVRYAKSKNVDLILWTVFNVLDNQLEAACAKYAAMGIKGFKVDFLDRDDQTAVEQVYRIAEATAKHKLTLDLHGMYKPTGLNRTYPNIINFESVFGMEEVKWSKVEKDMMKYDVTMPYIRMMAGPIDYTPGAMRNSNKKNFRDVYYEPMSQGTRCHQLATYIVHDSPLTMLADNPTTYYKENECTQFIASIPNVGIEETKIVQGTLGEYIVTARRIGDNWYVGGLTDWTKRSCTLDFSFLPKGNYQATIFTDGANAEKTASDYQVKEMSVNNTTQINIDMAPGGGFAIRLIKKN